MVTPKVLQRLAPSGRLRASINTGNPVLARLDDHGGASGVSVDLAGALARRLGVPLELVVLDTAGKSVQAVSEERADVGFFAIDPARAETLSFTDAYVLIEGCYLVRDGSPIAGNEEVDREGTRVTVGAGSAYDLFLTRELRHAHIDRAASSPAVVETFLATQADVAAGVRQQLEGDAARLGGLRVLPGRFMVIRQAMGCPRSRGDAATSFLTEFVEAMKAEAFIADALARHGIEGASVAPARST